MSFRDPIASLYQYVEFRVYDELNQLRKHNGGTYNMREDTNLPCPISIIFFSRIAGEGQFIIHF